MTTNYKTRVDLVNWKTANGDNDEVLVSEIDNISSRASDLYRTNALAKGIIQCKAVYVIGKGLSAIPSIDHRALNITPEVAAETNSIIAREWETFSNTSEIDTRGQNTFNELQEILYKAKLLHGNGICLLTLNNRKDSDYRTSIQPIDSTLLSNPNNEPESVRLTGGIQLNSRGRVTHYSFKRAHDGTSKTGAQHQQWQTVKKYGNATGLQNICHAFQSEEPGQLRGVSLLASISPLLKNLDDYIRSTVDASILSSKMFMFVKTPDGEGFSLDEKSNNEYTVNGITATNLAVGEEIIFQNAQFPQSTFDVFQTSILKSLASASEIPLEILIKYFTSSYSAARFGTLDFARIIQRERVQFISSVCSPIYARFMYELALKNILPMRGFFENNDIRRAWSKHSFIGTNFGAINPLQEINSELLMVDRGLKTLNEVSLSLDGQNTWEDKQIQVSRERNIIREQLPTQTTSVNDKEEEKTDE